MENILNQEELIEKETIPGMHFEKTDVLDNPDARKIRQSQIHRATILGNAYHGKVMIHFQNTAGELKKVYTTIWDYDNEYVILKSGSSLPIRAITEVEFY